MGLDKGTFGFQEFGLFSIGAPEALSRIMTGEKKKKNMS